MSAAHFLFASLQVVDVYKRQGKTYDGTIVLADTGGKYVNYRIEVQKLSLIHI